MQSKQNETLYLSHTFCLTFNFCWCIWKCILAWCDESW